MSTVLTFAHVEADAIARERAGAVAWARRHIAGTEALIAHGRIGAEAASLLQERIGAFIEMIEQGLHVGAAREGARDDS